MRKSLALACVLIAASACGPTAPVSGAGPLGSPTASPPVVPSVAPAGEESPSVTAVFDGAQALARVGEQLGFGDRSPGTPGHASTSAWIQANLREAGWKVSLQDFVYKGVKVENITGSRGAGQNGRYILLGAHYDTRPVADQSPGPDPGPVPGANDGASGVAVLLGLADTLPRQDLSCRVDLAFFDAEDSGELNGWGWVVGSNYMATHLDRKPDAVVVVDMVGDASLQLYKEANSDAALRSDIWATGEALGYTAFIDQVKYSMIDDHTPFLRQGMRAVDIIDFDYPYWHTVQDTLDKVSAESLATVGTTLDTWLKAQCP